MSLSVTRERRPNAGSKMSYLMDSGGSVDHFYDSLYGGFEDDNNDNDYKSSESDSEDIIDSDFSIDENEEEISDDQNDRQLKPKTKRNTNFGYNSTKRQKSYAKKVQNESINESEVRVPLEINVPSMRPIFSRKSSRIWRKCGHNCGEKIIKDRLKCDLNVWPKPQIKSKIKPKLKTSEKGWTQKELLEEAVITEKLNLKSLEEYQRSQSLRAKTNKVAKHSMKGPFIRLNSVSMPRIQELNQKSSEEMAINDNQTSVGQHSRTFITFSDDKTYDSFVNSVFKSSTAEVPEIMVCPVTQLPARYFDPISQMPFANTEAFNAIRGQYYKNLEEFADNNQNDVKEWIDWRHQYEDEWKEWQQKYVSYERVPQKVIDCESQVISTEPNVPDNQSIAKTIHSRRKKKLF